MISDPLGVVLERSALSSLYSIVIPTRERPDVLRHTIKTVLKQTRSNYELVIMDNGGSPATRAVVEELDDPHIRYFRSPTSLNMTDSWEQALGHATGDYVTILGDDDGMMPDAVEVAERLHRDHPDDVLSWMPFMWVWPDAVVKAVRGLTQIHFGSHVEVRSSRSFLQDLLASRADFRTLPTLYCSFVPRRLIDDVRSRFGGQFFVESSPDIFSGMAVLGTTERFLYSYRPLTVTGLSRHSTGLSHWYVEGEAGDRFYSEHSEQMAAVDPRFRGLGLIVEVMVANCYLKGVQRFFPDDGGLTFDMEAFLHRVCAYPGRFARRWDEFTACVREMAELNGLDPAQFELRPPRRPPGSIGFHYELDPARNLTTVTYHTDPRRVPTIAEFVADTARLCLPAGALGIRDTRSMGAGGPPARSRA